MLSRLLDTQMAVKEFSQAAQGIAPGNGVIDVTIVGPCANRKPSALKLLATLAATDDKSLHSDRKKLLPAI